MSQSNEAKPSTIERPALKPLPEWPLYLIYALLVAYIALWLLMVVASCSNSRTDPAVPAASEEAIETPYIVPEPDEGRAP